MSLLYVHNPSQRHRHFRRMDDRSTMFYNPFRRTWVQSIRRWDRVARRCRYYYEDADFIASGGWQPGDDTPWARADAMDQGSDAWPELYNLDAIAYESVMLGFHQILRGPPNHVGQKLGLPKLTELTLGYSRDGFHWHRPDRTNFIGARREPGSWAYGYVESSAGMCCVVGDELWLYYSAYAGNPDRTDGPWTNNGMYANGAVGLARMRRDGFASMSARFPGAEVGTRPITFTGSRLFVNVSTGGSALRAAVVDADGESLEGFAYEDCLPFIGNETCVELRWREHTLGELAGRPVRLRFRMDRGELFAFWVTDSTRGASGGYLGAGGPGYGGLVDRA